MLVLAVGIAFCGAPEASAQSAKVGPRIAAVEDLRSSLDAVALEWQRQTGLAPSLTYLAPDALIAKAEEGGDVDIVALGDRAAMERLEKDGRVRKNTRTTLTDVLALVAGPDGPAAVAPGPGLPAALGTAKIALCFAPQCGSGAMALEALKSLGVWEALEPLVVRAESSDEVMALIVRQEVKLGILYGSEAKREPKLKVVGAFPSATHRPVLYPMAATTAAKEPAVIRFLSFLRSQAATKIFAARGLTVFVK